MNPAISDQEGIGTILHTAVAPDGPPLQKGDLPIHAMPGVFVSRSRYLPVEQVRRGARGQRRRALWPYDNDLRAPSRISDDLVVIRQRDEFLGIARNGIEAPGLPLRLCLLDPFQS